MSILQLLYLASATLFILGIRGLSSPETARKGMNLAAFGMLLAIVGTLFHHEIVTYKWIIAGLILGSAIGVPMSLWIPMTAVPQRTALSHAGGALAACLIGVSEYYRHGISLGTGHMAIIGVEVLLGALTTTGSLMAAAKLQGLLPGRPITYPFQNASTISLLAFLGGFIVYLTAHPGATHLFYILLACSFLFGILLLVPIGAADMPCVITLLNAYAGLTDAAMGFMLANRIQIVTGSLDGSSGLILSILMCRAMNRPFTNILFGAFGKVEEASTEVLESKKKSVKSLTIEEAVNLFNEAKRVIIVPGYGMAAAQAQHAVRDVADKLKALGVAIKYAIHPVAGRMPGHMNVLLAEANVPYPELFDMDDINPEFSEADVALVVGANDVTNPAARHVKSSPIYGMPILDVDKAKKVIVFKRSMAPGFAGIDNDLYLLDHTWMLFGDAKDSFTKLAGALQNVALQK
ncbi:MAG: NAD(P)(+) transhydrogenase (Re/Si-specific) subunit beta [Elusimicrobia bacterium]|nr:NAD(P)(+) transhydrogenase (Re/Si-specific) subunit beta [Elusimicrobiota bacterium]